MELPKGDFAVTIIRQLFASVHALLLLDRLKNVSHNEFSGIAAKAHKEARYHARHAADWVRRLGDGTSESHDRAQRAVDDLWRYTGELFDTDDVEMRLVARGLAVDASTLQGPWLQYAKQVLSEATLQVPGDTFMQRGGRIGRHTEHLGHMLAEMQILARSFPGASW
jgi:ring-1,2-phenylacetyl-CoA epoxidase subunit PaaC